MTRDDDRLSPSDPPVDEGASFVRSIQATFGAGPSDDVARAHLAAMTDAAREAAHTVPEEVLPMRKTWLHTRTLRYAAIAVAAMVAAMSVGTGLSFAGVVTLPQPVRAVLQGVGIEVPDDDADEAAEDADEGVENDDDQGEDAPDVADADEADDDSESTEADDDEADDDSESTDTDDDEADDNSGSGSVDDDEADDDSGSGSTDDDEVDDHSDSTDEHAADDSSDESTDDSDSESSGSDD